MAQWIITKEFSFEYGHRVWNQFLNKEFSIDNQCVCKSLHGHSGKVEVSLKASVLESGMVTDFKHLNFFKKWLDTNLDHKLILDIQDPTLFHHFPLLSKSVVFDEVFDKKEENFYNVKFKVYEFEDINLHSTYGGLVGVPFVPTSENLSKWFFDIIQLKMNQLNILVDKVTLFETVKSQSCYQQ